MRVEGKLGRSTYTLELQDTGIVKVSAPTQKAGCLHIPLHVIERFIDLRDAKMALERAQERVRALEDGEG